MALTDGTFRVGPENGRLLLRTGREGMAQKAGHDLTIEVTRWEATVQIDTTDPARSTISVAADADSFAVREGTGGVKPLTDSDREQIRKTIREKVLHTAAHPQIVFTSHAVEGDESGFVLHGELTTHGQTHPLDVAGRVDGDRVSASTTVVQTRWGVTPYKGLLGALKLRDAVRVEVDVALGGPAS